ncbi:MAG TPA: Na+/H+ antiporter subunit E [Marinobacter hydrocarbonoclasticus]|jgi:multicomponent Na+:H+ antiporter subunit E|uniref:Na(+) H(+) antiporter subunit E n=1 Tax=Marinobacter nauticus TaxID=2743 RepID=A0A833JNJ7_MARNT|nr:MULTISPECIES: Na+/H+ antiporter subunit E [Marinobacter]MEC7432682.1 Na+/H+ antiporter subunit E [Pseudomonadota bacterium]KAE8545149.1 Na(+) H(+) antiporter subunit E [Marinobacter nauticus]MAC22389.1 Na+/H+ antiporter subunit E [Marinobacter sp.]MAL33750.1 Na+/H+ antiporter subunit E [Marinobacter sp.]MAP31219.1 Na+/H+ antiporter subunit E [Marinobacter sp.]|tara:strand:+ start:118 stop:591 length:474 start_codon:yes stop_codon:yes gene_type:complete
MIGLFWNLLLALAWVTLTGSITAMNLLAGFIFGYVALMVLQKQVPVLKGYSRRIPRLVAFLLYFLKELVKSNLRVAYDIATPVWHMKPGVIAFPLRAETDMEILFVSSVISLTPGTLSLDVSDDRKVLFIHAMFLHDEEQLRNDLRELERRILKVTR